MLIVGDTFRADKLSSQGGPDGLTPYLDRMASEGVRFEVARSHAPWTLPSTASLLTSLHPSEHGAGGKVNDFRQMSTDVKTIAARFQSAGYDTHAIVNVDFLAPENFGVTRDFGGVDNVSYASNVEVRTADATTDAALAWLDGRGESDRPFFLMVHYFDPHCVYAPPELQRKRWAQPADRESEWTFGTRSEMLAIRAGQLTPDEPTLRRAEALYDGEIAYLDGQIGRLDDGLKARVGADDLVTVFTSDHGEEFYDHQGFEHGHTLFEELVRVPLIVRAPGQIAAGSVVTSAVRHIDVAPTLCELADIALDDQYVGSSLVPLVGGRANEDRGTLAHGNFWDRPMTSWTKDGWKLVERETGAPRLYHLSTDPKEREDLAASEPERLAAMAKQLAAVREGLRAVRAGEGAELSPEVRANLKGLGYGH
ncbi:Arylsulfatase [Planctomycetes bacterium Poly30]|uniref:Arylsulfatase n=1 Tax=Saltatorellus ferox TaxID=2528018 RepID=A0A518EVN7_9BACT|nr:Arylsulfatase [Planctomycetes bacterium Poly30]